MINSASPANPFAHTFNQKLSLSGPTAEQINQARQRIQEGDTDMVQDQQRTGSPKKGRPSRNVGYAGQKGATTRSGSKTETGTGPHVAVEGGKLGITRQH
jgi:hypothetical protein